MSTLGSIFRPIDLSALPAPQVVEPLNFEALFSAFRADLLARIPGAARSSVASVLALESEPLTKLAQAIAYRELLLRQRMNEEALALMLAYATGSDLDHIGVTYFYGTARHVVQEEDLTATPPKARIMETDADYRRRLSLQPASVSVAGPVQAYIFHALSAHANVADATAISPTPANVTVTVLGRNAGNVPDEETLDAVRNALNDSLVRPVADRVLVQAAEIVDYQITAAVTVPHGPDASAIGRAIADNVRSYKDAPRRLARDVARSAIYAALHVSGVERVELTHPATDIALSSHQASRCTAVNITINGAALPVM